MSGDESKAERFLAHLEPLQGVLEAYCRRHLHDSTAVEDVLQNALADAFRNFHLYVENTNFRAWIFRHLNLEILEHNRQFNRREETLVGSAETIAEESWDATIRGDLMDSLFHCPEAILDHCDSALVAALDELSHEDRSVLLLRAIGDFKYSEIAEILGVPVGTVMSRLSRTRGRLRQRLAEFGRREGYLED